MTKWQIFWQLKFFWDSSKTVLDSSKTVLDSSKTVLCCSKAVLDNSKTVFDSSKLFEIALQNTTIRQNVWHFDKNLSDTSDLIIFSLKLGFKKFVNFRFFSGVNLWACAAWNEAERLFGSISRYYKTFYCVKWYHSVVI